MIFLIGGRGRLGQALMMEYADKHPVLIDRAVYEDWWKEGAEKEIFEYFEQEDTSDSVIFVTAGLLDPNLPAEDLLRVNYLLPKNIIKGTAELGIKVVTFGTIMEELGESKNPYIQSKRALSAFVKELPTHQTSAIHIRIHTLYGNGAPSPFMFLGQIQDAILNNHSFEMTSGNQLREYHHIEDEVKAIKRIASTHIKGVFNLNHGESVALKEIAQTVFIAFGKQNLLKIGAIPDPAVDNFNQKFEKPDLLQNNRFRSAVPAILHYLQENINKKNSPQGNTVKPLISISIPVLNEADNIEQLYSRLVSVSETMKDRCDLEFVFSDNHSDDNTWSLLRQLATKDPRVKAIRFSKNFGFQRSILANYLHTKGDAVMQIDADLQDPPEMLEMFFEQWQRGFHVVYGIRKKRQEGWLINQFRRLGYWLIDKISEYPIPRDVGDFRLIDRKIITAISEMKTPSPYIRGMIAGVGFDQCGIPYERNCRVAGNSKFNLIRLIRLGLTAVFNHSTIPLRVSSFLGTLILVITTLGALYYYILHLLESDLPRGFTSTQILILFGIGLNSFFLGIIGEYLLRIYLLLRSERLAIVEQSINFSSSELKL